MVIYFVPRSISSKQVTKRNWSFDCRAEGSASYTKINPPRQKVTDVATILIKTEITWDLASLVSRVTNDDPNRLHKKIT